MSDSEQPRISVIIPSCDRKTLNRAIRSSHWADEIVVVFDAEEPPRRPSGCVVLAVGPTNDWGTAQRNLAMTVASGTHLAFMDDDDVYARGAGQVVRKAVSDQPERVHVFSMRNADTILSGPLESGKISTQMYVVPRQPVAQWKPRYGHDVDFIVDTMALRGDEPVYHPDVISVYRPPTVRRGLRALVRPRTQVRALKRWLQGARRL